MTWRNWWRRVRGLPPPLTLDVFVARITPLDADGWALFVRGDPCTYCGAPADTAEHVLPRSVGGRTNSDNLVGACLACNNTRGAAPLLVFLLWRARPRKVAFRTWYGNFLPRPVRPLAPRPARPRRAPSPLMVSIGDRVTFQRVDTSV